MLGYRKANDLAMAVRCQTLPATKYWLISIGIAVISFIISIRGPTKSDFRYRYIATKIPYRPGMPSTILYYRSRKYARINIDVYAAELSVSQYKKCMKELATK